MGSVIIENVSKTLYFNNNSTNILQNIDLKIDHGFTAICGPAGSGKSTLLNIIGGLERPTSGMVKVNNTDLSIFDEEGLAIFRRRNVGFIFRDYHLIPIMNAYENIIFPLQIDDRIADRDYIMQIAEFLNIEDKMSYLPKHLSVGERQKVAIARALANKPPVVLADQPTVSLDSNTSQEVIELLRLTSKEFNQVVIMITHKKEIAELTDRVIYLCTGKIARVHERRENNDIFKTD